MTEPEVGPGPPVEFHGFIDLHSGNSEIHSGKPWEKTIEKWWFHGILWDLPSGNAFENGHFIGIKSHIVSIVCLEMSCMFNGLITYTITQILAGRWFGPFFIFPYIGNNQPN